VLDLLGSLVNDSLIRRTETPDGEVRFEMLETIREYANEKLDEEPDAADVRRLHARFFLELAVRGEAHLLGPDQKEWLDSFDREHDNLRAAISWSIRAGEVLAGQEAAGALWRFWHQRGHLAEGRSWLEKLLSTPGGASRNPQRFKALTGAGGLAYWQNDYAGAERFYSEALEIAQDLDDPRSLVEALFNLSFIDRIRGDEEEGMAKIRRSQELARSLGDREMIANIQWLLGNHELRADRPEQGLPMVEEALKVFREVGNRFSVAESLSGLGSIYRRIGKSEEATTAQREALEIFIEVDNPTGIATALQEMAIVETMEGRDERALRLAGAASALRHEVGGGPPAELMRTDKVLTESRARLRPEAAEAAWNEGTTMGTDKAIALALEGPDRFAP
jgi:tetratricopeptide (TPR) repeat protein